MKATVFHGTNDIRVEEVKRPPAGVGGDHRIVTTLCPGGKVRMRRLLTLVQSGRFDPTPLITHRFSLDEITQGYQLFGERLDGVLKVAIKP